MRPFKVRYPQCNYDRSCKVLSIKRFKTSDTKVKVKCAHCKTEFTILRQRFWGMSKQAIRKILMEEKNGYEEEKPIETKLIESKSKVANKSPLAFYSIRLPISLKEKLKGEHRPGLLIRQLLEKHYKL